MSHRTSLQSWLPAVVGGWGAAMPGATLLAVLALACAPPKQVVPAAADAEAEGLFVGSDAAVPADLGATKADASQDLSARGDVAQPKGDAADSASGDMDAGTPADTAPAEVAGIDDVLGTDSGADTAQPDATAAACAAAEKLCSQAFSWPAAGDESSVEVRGSWDGWKKGLALSLAGSAWTGAFLLPQAKEFQYKFRIVRTSGKEEWKPDPQGALNVDDGFGGKNTVLAALSCPDTGSCPIAQTICGVPAKAGAFDWRDAVMYFVFVDRFVDGDPSNNQKATSDGLADIANYAGGDWKGVTQKIQAGWFKDLGVNVLWLSVPMQNTAAVEYGEDGKKYTSYHGYWPTEVAKPNPAFGQLAELQALVQAAHAQGIQIVLDYAMNHVHKDSSIYKDHPSWFHPGSVNGQPCVCGTSVCPWDGPSGVWCWFRDYLPDFDFNQADARKASIDNVIWWMQQSGADGLRLDAIKHVEAAWLTELRDRLLTEVEPVRGQHIWLVGETYTGDQGFIKGFVDPCAKLDGQFDFPLRAVLDQVVLLRQGKMKDLEKFMIANDAFYGPGAIMSTFAGNHDLPRIIHYAQDNPLFGDVWDSGKAKAWSGQPGVVAEKSAYERVAVAMAVLMASPGVPLIYYGDELGMPGAGDPDNRRPMAWSGWSDNQKWLLQQHKKLGAVRQAHPALRRGVRQSLYSSDDAWVWSMSAGSDVVYVAVNRSDASTTVDGLPTGDLVDLLSGDKLTGTQVPLPPRAVRMLVVSP